MKKSKLILILALLTCLAIGAPARAGDVYGSTYAATMQSAATATGNGTAMDCGGLATVAFVVSGTFVGTVTFEGTVDGTTWAALLAYNVTSGSTSSTATSGGTYVVNSAGLSRVRARVSAYTSGSITVAARGTVAHTNSLAFSGGGSSPTLMFTGSNVSLGSTDAHPVSIKTAGQERIYVDEDGTISLQDNLLTDVATPLSDYDAANKAYVDARLPWVIDVDLTMPPNSSVGSWTVNHDTQANGAVFVQSAGAQDSELAYELVLAAGTWALDLEHLTANNYGIVTAKIGSTTVGTIDTYSSGSAVYNVRSSITGITVSSTGRQTVHLVMASKNASSAGYYGTLQKLRLRRTS